MYVCMYIAGQGKEEKWEYILAEEVMIEVSGSACGGLSDRLNRGGGKTGISYLVPID